MNMKIKMLIFVLTMCVAATAVSGCKSSTGSDDVQAEPSGEKKLVFGSTQGAQTVNPADGYQGWYTIRYGVGETLFKLDDTLEPQPWLATDYQLEEDKLTWIITIRDGVTFQSGNPMDAAAVKACLERTVQMNDRAPTDLMIDSMEADGQMLTIKTTAVNPTLINSLCDPYACIIDTASDTDMSVHPMGTGPYMVETLEEGRQVVLIPNSSYWDGAPKLDKVVIKEVTDGDTLTMALQSQEVDAAEGIPYSNQALFEEDDNYKISGTATSRVFKLYYNFDNKHLSNANVRKALNKLIDKAGFGSIILNGSGTPATGAFPGSSPYGEGLKATEFDVEGAKELLKQEGYEDTDGDGFLDKDGEKLSFRLVTYGSRAELPILSDAIQSQYRDVGIDMSIEVSDNCDELLAAGDFDISAYAYVTLPTGDPLSYLNFVVRTQGGRNYGRYSNEQVDRLLTQLGSEIDLEQRYELAQQVQQIILEEDAYCFMEYLNMAFVMKKGVSGLKVHPADYYQINVDTDISE